MIVINIKAAIKLAMVPISSILRVVPEPGLKGPDRLALLDVVELWDWKKKNGSGLYWEWILKDPTTIVG